MDIFISQFHFLRPWAFISLFLLVFIIYRMKKGAQTVGSWQKICSPELLAYLQVGASAKQSFYALWLVALAGILAIIALAGPVWQQQPQPVYREDSALIIALDLSRSMDASDVQPSRLQRAKQKLRDVLALRKEGQTALIAFAGTAYVVTPLTEDTQTIVSQLQGLSTDIMPKQGGKIDSAIEKAVALFQQASIKHGQLLLLTDSSDVSQAVVTSFTKAGHQLSVIAVGTEQGAPIPKQAGGFVSDRQGNIVIASLDTVVLQRLAAWGDGFYHTLSLDNTDIAPVLTRLKPSMLEKMRVQDQQQAASYDMWREEGPWLLLAVIPLVLIGFRRGLLVVVLCLTMQPQPVEASESDVGWHKTWNDMWHTRNQQAEALMSAKQYAQASETFEDPAWKMAAHYKAKNYAAAVQDFEAIKKPNVDDIYNKGNALAQLGKLDAAIAAYDNVLKKNPEHDDAKANKALLEKLKKEQAKQNDKPDKDQQGKKQDKQSNKQQNKDKQGKDQQSKGQQGKNQKNKGEQSKNQQSKAKKGKREQNNAEQAKKQQGKGQQDAEKQRKSEQAKEQQDKKQQAKNKQGKEPSGVGHKLHEDELKKLEAKQNFEQTLRRVPDDPGGLLRRKFLYQYQQQGKVPAAQDDKQW